MCLTIMFGTFSAFGLGKITGKVFDFEGKIKCETGEMVGACVGVCDCTRCKGYICLLWMKTFKRSSLLMPELLKSLTLSDKC